MKRKKFVNYLLWFIILCWAGIATIYWSLNPHIASYMNDSMHASANAILHGFTLIGVDILILLLGYLFPDTPQKESRLIKTWLTTWVIGSLVTFVVSLLWSHTPTFASTIYNALFPILRNSYPLIIGLGIGLMMDSLMARLTLDWQNRIYISVWIIVGIAFFTYPNMWGWSDNNLSIFYGVVFLLGNSLKQFKLKPIKIWSSCLIIAILYFALQLIAPFFNSNGPEILRFSTPSNLLALMLAYLVTCLIVNKLKPISWYWTISYLTIIENSALVTSLVKLFSDQVGQSSFKLGLLTVITVLTSMLMAFVCHKLLISKPGQQLSTRINQFAANDKRKQLKLISNSLRDHWPLILSVIISYGLAALSAILIRNQWTIEPNVDLKYNIFVYIFGLREINLLFSALIIFLTFKFIQAITKRYWVSLGVIIIVNAIIIVASRVKIDSRAEPILPADFMLINVFQSIFRMVNIRVWIIAGIILALAILLIIWLEKIKPIVYKAKSYRRVIYLLLAPLLFLSSLTWNHTGPQHNFMIAIDNEPMFYKQIAGAQMNGPVVQFLNNLDLTIMDKPSGYSQQAMVKIEKRYSKRAQRINLHRVNSLQNQTIIFNLSESLANPNRVPGIKLRNNPIPYITQVKHDNTGGIMMSSGYGGGTANMEYMTLTGFALSNFSPILSTPYTQLVSELKFNPAFTDYFNHKIAIHPYQGSFYNRIGVYQKFGFDKFYYLGSKYKIKHQHKIERSPYLSDETSYDNVLDAIHQYRHGQFINLVTMQNHFPYDANHYHHLAKYKAVKVSSGTNTNALNEYSTGIHYTDQAVQKFIHHINQINRPVTVVFYGDHLPGNVYGNDTTKDGVVLHETDYFIYSNRYARNHGAINLHKDTQFVSPNDFIAMVAEQTNSKVDWYLALLTDVYKKLPVMFVNQNNNTTAKTRNTNVFVNQKGKVVKYSQLSKKQKRLYHDYQLVQYDITAGKHYLVKDMK